MTPIPASSPAPPERPWLTVLPVLEDGFARADDPTVLGVAESGQTWQQLTFGGAELGIQDGKAYTSTLGAAAIGYVPPTFTDGWLSVDLVLGMSAPTIVSLSPLLWRTGISGGFSGYQVIVIGGDLVLARIDPPGVADPLDSIPSPQLQPGEHVRLRAEFEGDQHRVYVDNVLSMEATDATYPGPGEVIGFQLNATEIFLDRILAGAGAWPGYQPYRVP